jgi:hypothetical protein
LVTGLNHDTVYQFKVIARNEVGYGPDSEIVSIRASAVPSQPDAPVTAFVENEADSNADYIVVTWTTPVDDGGSDITSYQVLIKQSDNTWREEPTNCDASVQSIFDGKTC